MLTMPMLGSTTQTKENYTVPVQVGENVNVTIISIELTRKKVSKAFEKESWVDEIIIYGQYNATDTDSKAPESFKIRAYYGQLLKGKGGFWNNTVHRLSHPVTPDERFHTMMFLCILVGWLAIAVIGVIRENLRERSMESHMDG